MQAQQQHKNTIQDDMRQYQLWEVQRRIARTRLDKYHAMHMEQLWKQVWNDQDLMLCELIAQEAKLVDLICCDRELPQQRQDGLPHSDGGRADGERP